MSDADKPRTPPNHLPQAEAPPTFNCHIYLTRQDDGRVQADVVNLAGISITADNERSALQQAVGQFKSRVTELHAAGGEIPWQEPAALPAGASERFLAVHL